MANELVLAGIVGSARGLNGEVFVEVRTDRTDEVFSSGSLLIVESARDAASKAARAGAFAQGLPKQLTVAGRRVHGGRTALRFEEVTTREQAEALKGVHLMTPEVHEDDAWYPHQLEGLQVQTPEGESLGVVSGLAQGSAHDFLLVRHGTAEVMVPFVAEMVPEVRTEDGLVIVDAPVGLFESDPVEEPDSN